MSRKLRLLTLIATLYLNVSPHLYSQQAEETKHAVKVTAFAYTDSIAIRWAVTTPVAWQLVNKYGYYVERTTITRDNKIIRPEIVKIFTAPLKPWSSEKWIKIIDTNDMAAIAAQAIFGTSFETTSNYNSDVLQVINQSKELEQRYSFATLAADLSRITATASASSFVDKQVKKNEKYLYKIYTAIPINTMQVDTGFVFIGVSDRRELPKPVKVQATPSDKTIMLSWARNYYDDLYVGYQVEKSQDGKNFKKITNLPIINTEPATGVPADRFYKLDSLAENGKQYHYRVRGLSAFGDVGPPSDAVIAVGLKPFKSTAAITDTEVLENSRVVLRWIFPEDAVSDLKGFNLWRSNNPDTNFKVVNSSLIPSKEREYEDMSPNATNYYKVEAISNNEQISISFPNLLQLEDSIPPQAPNELKAQVSANGVVKLAWEANTEIDLLGYRVYRANFKNDEYSQITSSPVSESLYIDTITIQTLTEKVYYKIAAIDSRFNTSLYSNTLEVARPDIQPPAPALFSDYKITSEGVFLAWIPSPSSDVVKHEIYRTTLSDDKTILLNEFYAKDTIKSYTDVSVESATKYAYSIVALDDAGLRSKSAQMLKVSIHGNIFSQASLLLVVKSNRNAKRNELRWTGDYKSIKSIQIYRSVNDEPITLYKTISYVGGFDDDSIKIGATYRYRIQSLFKNGNSSKISEEVVVEY